jgi:hypothetical protein
MQSIQNFVSAQRIRDDRRQELSASPRLPPKTGSRSGDRDYAAWNQIQRREMDNARELIRLLQSGGLEFFARARQPKDEDTFVLGPDVVGALEQKIRIMRRRWLDVQDHLVSPSP